LAGTAVFRTAYGPHHQLSATLRADAFRAAPDNAGPLAGLIPAVYANGDTGPMLSVARSFQTTNHANPHEWIRADSRDSSFSHLAPRLQPYRRVAAAPTHRGNRSRARGRLPALRAWPPEWPACVRRIQPLS